jgi:hypothetical protein
MDASCLRSAGFVKISLFFFLFVPVLVLPPAAASAFAGSDCPSVSGLAFLGGSTFAEAGISGRDGIHCQYSLPGTCRESPCTAFLRVDRTASPAAAGSLMDTISPPGVITSIQSMYTVVDSGQTADHRYVVFKNNPGNNDPRATTIAGALVYKGVYVIQAESSQNGYWVVSDSAAKSVLAALENAGKSVVDKKVQTGSAGTSSQPVRTPTLISGSNRVPGSSGSPEVMMSYVNPGPSGTYGYDSGTSSFSDGESTPAGSADDSSAGSAAAGAVVLLGGVAAVGYTGIKIYGAMQAGSHAVQTVSATQAAQIESTDPAQGNTAADPASCSGGLDGGMQENPNTHYSGGRGPGGCR